MVRPEGSVPAFRRLHQRIELVAADDVVGIGGRECCRRFGFLAPRLDHQVVALLRDAALVLADGLLSALALDTGEVRWRFDLGARGLEVVSLAPQSRQVFLALADGRLACVEPA